MARVLSGLRDDVQEHPPRRPGRTALEPRRIGQRLSGVQIGQGPDQFVGRRGYLVVLLEEAGEALPPSTILNMFVQVCSASPGRTP